MKTIKNNLYMLGFVIRSVPGYFVANLIYVFNNGVLGAVSGVWFTKVLFDMLERQVDFRQILILIGVIAGIRLWIGLYCYWFWRVIDPNARENLHGKMHRKLFEVARTTDLACFDDPQFFNDFLFANHEADNRAVTLMLECQRLLSILIRTLITAGILISIDWRIAIMIVAAVVLTTIFQNIGVKVRLRRDEEKNPIERKSEYVSRMFYLADYAKELRLSHADEVLKEDYKESVEKTQGVFRKYGKKLFALSVGEGLATDLLVDIGILVYLTWRLTSGSGELTLGDFAACVTAMWNLFWGIRNFLDKIAAFREHGLYSEKLRTFLNYRPKVTSKPGALPAPERFGEVTLSDVTFTYPGSEQPTLNGISLTIKRGQKIALVGYNGAGKSTLIKLLMRLYDPTEGEIRVNGQDIRDVELDSYRKSFGAVFQDYRLYATTIAENVLMDECRTKEDRERATEALAKSGFSEKLAALEKGIDTQLTREFFDDGEILSGGEAQKVAIARVFAHPSEIVILDEPSSALDPVSEYELNHAMMSAAFDKTVIFISHRLSTTCMADVIYMLEDGRIIESGSHEELMKRDGKYAEMFRVQAEKYRKEKEKAAKEQKLH